MTRKTKIRTMAGAAVIALALSVAMTADWSSPKACYGAKCDPTISVTNTSWFGQLLKRTSQNFLVNQAKMALLSKLNLEFLPGGFSDMFMGELANITDLSGKIDGVMSKGLADQFSYMNSQMSAEAFRGVLNRSLEQTVQSSLSTVKDLTREQISQAMGAYQGQFLMAQQVFSTYASPAQGYQSMMKNFMGDANSFTSTISDLGTKVDMADFVRGQQGLGSIINTEAVIREANTFLQSGIQNVVAINGYDIGVSIESDFAAMNTGYLKGLFESLKNQDGTPAMTKEEIDTAITAANRAASSTTAGFLQQTSGDLTRQAHSLNTNLQNTLKNTVGSAEKVIANAISTEKAQSYMAQTMNSAIQDKVKDAMGDVKKWTSVAADPNALSYNDTEKVALLLAGPGKKTHITRINAKYWLVAKESSDVAKNLQERVRMFNAAAIDKKPEDAAWKDAARFQYYTLMLQNQQMKLLAVRAMAIAANYAVPGGELEKFIEKEGLPAGF